MTDISNFTKRWDGDGEALTKAVDAALTSGNAGDNASTLDAGFEAAAVIVKTLAQEPSQDEMLQLYAYFKQGKQTPPEKPGMFDLKKKYMYQAWEKVSNISYQQAQAEYIKLVDSLIAKYDTK